MVEWELENADRLPHLEMAQAQGATVRTLDERPRLPGHLGLHLRAWRELAGESLSFTDVRDYAREVGVRDVFGFWDRVVAFEEARNAGRQKSLGNQGG